MVDSGLYACVSELPVNEVIGLYPLRAVAIAKLLADTYTFKRLSLIFSISFLGKLYPNWILLSEKYENYLLEQRVADSDETRVAFKDDSNYVNLEWCFQLDEELMGKILDMFK